MWFTAVCQESQNRVRLGYNVHRSPSVPRISLEGDFDLPELSRYKINYREEVNRGARRKGPKKLSQ